MGTTTIKNHWSLVIIVSVWLIFASPYFLKGLIPFPSSYLVTFFPPWNASYAGPVKNGAMPDVISQIYPWKKLTIESWKRGEIPLWNPYSFSGTVHAANYQTAVFTPLNFLFFVLPFIDAWSLLILLQPLLAGMFMYLYLSTYVSKPARLIGSLAFMFCGFLVVWMAYGTLGYAALFLPLILWGIDALYRTNKRIYGLAISLPLAISFLSGHFQISVYVLLFVLAYILFKKFFLPMVFVLLGLGIALPQLWLSYDQFLQTARSVAFGKGEVIPWQYLVTLIAPDFYGNPVTRNDWFGHYAEWASYIGVLPILLAASTIFSKRTKIIVFYWSIVVISILLAFPSPLIDLLYVLKIPVLATSAASRIIVLASFSLAVLAAFGFEGFSKTKMKFVVFIAISLLIFLWIMPMVSFNTEKLTIAQRNSLLPSLLILAGLAVMFCLKSKHRHIAIVACIAIVGFDVLRFASKWMPFDPREFVYPETELSKFLEGRVGRDRVYGNIGGEFSTYFKLPFIEGYDTMYQARYGEFVSAASKGIKGGLERSTVRLDKQGEYSEKALQLLGVRYLAYRISDGQNIWAYPFWRYPWYQSIYKDETYEVLENTKSLPRMSLHSSYVINGDPYTRVVLEQAPEIEPTPGEGKVYPVKYSGNEVVARIEAEGPKILFLSDVYDKGWKADIDGRPAPVLRANYAFRAVAVLDGTHIVRFIYRPNGIVYGLPIAVVSMGILAAGVLWKKKG